MGSLIPLCGFKRTLRTAGHQQHLWHPPLKSCCMFGVILLFFWIRKKEYSFIFMLSQLLWHDLWFSEPFCRLSSPSAHFLCVTAPFPVSVEAIRKITQPPHITPFPPLVSFSIFRPARLFPPFSYLACSRARVHIWLWRIYFNHTEVIKCWPDKITRKAAHYLPNCCGVSVYILHSDPHSPFKVNHSTTRKKNQHWFLCGVFLWHVLFFKRKTH